MPSNYKDLNDILYILFSHSHYQLLLLPDSLWITVFDKDVKIS